VGQTDGPTWTEVDAMDDGPPDRPGGVRSALSLALGAVVALTMIAA
jgi:hypothetical protein